MDRFRLDQHRATTGWSLITRITTTLAARTLRARWRHLGLPIDEPIHITRTAATGAGG